MTVHPGIFTLEDQEEDPRRGKGENKQKVKNKKSYETTTKQKKGNTRLRE